MDLGPDQRETTTGWELHVSAIGTADLEHGFGQLPQRAELHRLHQFGEEVSVLDGNVSNLQQCSLCLCTVCRMKRCESIDLPFFFLGCCANDFTRDQGRRTFFREEGVYANDGIFPRCASRSRSAVIPPEFDCAGTWFPWHPTPRPVL